MTSLHGDTFFQPMNQEAFTVFDHHAEIPGLDQQSV
jgi:hypothetical protein